MRWIDRVSVFPLHRMHVEYQRSKRKEVSIQRESTISKRKFKASYLCCKLRFRGRIVLKKSKRICRFHHICSMIWWTFQPHVNILAESPSGWLWALQQTFATLPPWVNAGGTNEKQTHIGKNGFQVSLDVQHFATNGINVKSVNNAIVFNAKHVECQGEHSYVSCQFLRRYRLPESFKVDHVVSSISFDGILSGKTPPATPESNVQNQQTGPATERGRQKGVCRIQNQEWTRKKVIHFKLELDWIEKCRYQIDWNHIHCWSN